MSLILWTSSLSVGVASLDKQHQDMVRYINELHDSYQTGKSDEVLGPLLEKLIVYTHEHFALEERYFEQTSYPDADAHILEHRAFSKRISAFQKQYKDGDRKILMPLMKFLSDWLMHHIQETDQAYTPTFTAHNLS